MACDLAVDLEFDDRRGFLMVACAAGRLAVLGAANGGKKLGEVSSGMGVDVCAFNATLHPMYLAGQDSEGMSIIGISAAGVSTVLGKVAAAPGSQMVASDEYRDAWVGEPGGGRLFKIRDTSSDAVKLEAARHGCEEICFFHLARAK